MKHILRFFYKYGLLIAWILACIGTFLSIYFGEVKQVVPCTLCWYQRMAIFPLVIILGIATWRKKTSIISYVLPLTLIGLFFSAWHLIVQRFPGLLFSCKNSSICLIPHAFIGYFTMPLAAFIGMIIINLTLILTLISVKAPYKIK